MQKSAEKKSQIPHSYACIRKVVQTLVHPAKMLYDKVKSNQKREERSGTVKTILFDMDGVLVATEHMHYEALNRVLDRTVGRTMDWSYYAQFIGSTTTHLWRTLERDFALDGQTDVLHAAYTQQKIEFLAERGHTPVDGAPELVRALAARGHRMAVASSSPMNEITEAMEALGLTDCFALLVSGETVAHPKPAPDIFLLTAERLGVSPADCIVIEDSANGVRAAKAAGMTCIALRNPDSGNQDLTPADVIVDVLGDALRLIDGLTYLATDRLCLRPFTPDDAPALYELCRDPEVSRLTDWKPHESVQESQDVLRTVFLDTDTWAIIRKIDGQLMGAVGLTRDPKRSHPGARMLGYWLGTPYWGLGYMTEAAQVVCAEAFEELGVQLISAYYNADNTRSQRVLEKLGMRYEGRLRAACRTWDGRVFDEVCLSKTRAEYLQDRADAQGRINS